MNKAGERLYNGLIKENPTFVLMLGMCPTLAVTTSAMNGLGMGLTTAVVLALSNMLISVLRGIIPNRVRIPAFIVIIASFVTAVQLLLEGYIPSLNEALGMYIPLIVVNCIILGRAESYAYFNPPIPSLFDGVGMGLGFTFALTCIGAVRELLGTGKVFDYQILPDSFTPIGIFVLAPGAFFVLAALTAFQNYLKITRERAGKEYKKIQSGCSEDCMNCSDSGCSRRFYDNQDVKTEEKPEVKVEEKPEAKPEEKPEATVEEKTEENPEEKSEEKTEEKTEEKSEDKAEDKAEEKSDEKSENQEKTENQVKPKNSKKNRKHKKADNRKKAESRDAGAPEKQDLEVIDLDKEDV